MAGKLAQCGTPEEIYTSPVDAELAAFVGDANLIDGLLEGRLADTPLGRLPLRPGCEPSAARRPVTVLVRPEQICLHPGHHPEGLDGRVVQSSYHGHDTVVHVQAAPGSGLQVVVVRSAAGGVHLPPGTAVRLTAHGPVLAWPAANPVRAPRCPPAE